ncbi:MAG: cytochrome P450 [Pseudomonadota bacterium]
MALDTRPDHLPAGVTAPDAPLGLWASYRTARRNVLELIPAAAYHAPVIADQKRGRWIMLMDPEAIDHVLRQREADYPKSAILIRLMTPRKGQNLITTRGAVWQRQRRALSAPFRPRALAVADPIIRRAAAASVAALGAADGPVDVLPVMARATCDVMCDLALGGREAIDRDALTAAVDAYVAGIGRISVLDILGVPNWVPRPAAILQDSRKRMDDMADAVIAQRLARGASAEPDLLDLLIEAQSDGTLDALEVRNNLLGFLFAGHETTALALTWALYLLAFDPAVQTRARDCVRAACSDRPPGIDDLPRLGYVRQVVEEALRLYPPAGFLTRTARVADRIAGHRVRAGATVILPVYALHRHQGLWDAPERFDPDRFAPEKSAARPRGSYLPFGDGPRICIGMSLAMAEATLILAQILSALQITLPAGFAPRPTMWFTLRPAGGMPLGCAALPDL